MTHDTSYAQTRERAPQRALLSGIDTVRAIAGRKEAQRPGFFSFRRSLRVVPAPSVGTQRRRQRVRCGTCPLATAIVPNRFRCTHGRCRRRRRAGHNRVIPTTAADAMTHDQPADAELIGWL